MSDRAPSGTPPHEMPPDRIPPQEMTPAQMPPDETPPDRTPTGGTPPGAPRRPAPGGRIIAAQALMELKLLVRSGEALLVTLGIPLGILVFFSSVEVLPAGARAPVDFLVPGVLAISVMSTGLVQVGIQTGFQRSYGVLKRLGGTPLTRPRFLAAKGLAVAVVVAAQTLLVVVVAALGLGWEPAGSAALVVAVMALGGGTFTALGLLVAGRLSAEATLAVVNATYLVLLLISGVAFPRSVLPEPLAVLGAWLPAGALADALRAALLTPAAVDLGAVGLLAAWGLGSAAVAAVSFRWSP